jgi:hypothetical protein
MVGLETGDANTTLTAAWALYGFEMNIDHTDLESKKRKPF